MTQAYFQCTMRQGSSQTTGWIEARAAKVGLEVELPEFGGFWRVVAVHGKLDVDDLRSRQRANRNATPSIIGIQ